MTEPEKKDGMSVLDAVEEDPKKNGYTGQNPCVVCCGRIGVGSTLFWG